MSTTAPQNNGKVNQEPKQPETEWTVLLYMAGDNNLTEECVYALNEIKEGLNDNPRLKVIAQFDPAGSRATTKRYELRSIGTSTLDQDVKWEARETDTGEGKNLLEFVRWGLAEYPAKHNMVVLVGHGTGTDDDFLRDENPRSSLTILELQDVFADLRDDGHTIDILGMDTCLMSMAEVCYEMLRKNVTYMVGSEGFAPNTGWPYQAILGELSERIPTDGSASEVDPEELAARIVDQYQQFYKPYIHGGIAVDQSALKVAKIKDVQEAMFSLVRTLKEEFERGEHEYFRPKQNDLILAHWEAQSYNGEVFVDLYDFCDRLQKRRRETKYPNDAVIQRCEAVKAAIKDMVVNTQVAGAAFQYSFGLSIYFPWAGLSREYGNLSFPKATNWIDFLQLYLNKTRRRRNEQEPAPAVSSEVQPRPVLDNIPVRATPPTNKGRDGNVQSMRNPPTDEFVGTNFPLESASTNGGKPTAARSESVQWEDPNDVVTKEEAVKAVEELARFFMK